MAKILLNKKFYLLLAGLGVAAFIVINSYLERKREKSLSPETEVTYTENGFDLYTSYSRPSKRGRIIFGGLVPYGMEWRTGANEATIFSTDTPIRFGNVKLDRGRYQLLTVPYQDRWTIILNSKIPGWGINQQTGKVYHDPQYDVLKIDVPALPIEKSVEQFTIGFSKAVKDVSFELAWENTRVVIPITLL